MAGRASRAADVYGQLLWDFYRGKPALEIVERDDGYVSVARGPRGGPQVYFSTYKDWSAIEKTAMRMVDGTVLDIGCGAGRHSLYLQSQGRSVTGIDSSPLAIRVCKLRGLKNAMVLPISRVSQFGRGLFDSVVLLGNNLGLLGSAKGGRRLLRQLHRITSEDGKIIAETTDPHRTHDSDHLDYHKWNRQRGRLPGQIRLRIRHRTLTGPWMDYLFVSERELRELVAGTGWRVGKLIREKQPSAARYLAVMEKE